ncbi:MAG TPA: hypothetical protein VGA78_07605 [Gemmatimonadales bacterium]
MKRTRLASLLLLLASPALGGTLLPVLHPCPVDAPWTLAGGDHADHGNHHPAPAPAPEGNSHDCTCIDSCTPGPALVVAPDLRPVLPPAAFQPRLGPAGPDASLILAPTAERLPPATAPPLV